MTEPLKLGLAGLGTVGGGVLRLLAERGPALAKATGRPVEIVAVSARDRRKDHRGKAPLAPVDVRPPAPVEETVAVTPPAPGDAVETTLGDSPVVIHSLVRWKPTVSALSTTH